MIPKAAPLHPLQLVDIDRRIMHKRRMTFSPKDIRQLIDAADIKMKAMIWLGINCGFGCTDCAELKWSNLDFENNRVKPARKKTGI